MFANDNTGNSEERSVDAYTSDALAAKILECRQLISVWNETEKKGRFTVVDYLLSMAALELSEQSNPPTQQLKSVLQLR